MKKNSFFLIFSIHANENDPFILVITIIVALVNNSNSLC